MAELALRINPGEVVRTEPTFHLVGLSALDMAVIIAAVGCRRGDAAWEVYKKLPDNVSSFHPAAGERLDGKNVQPLADDLIKRYSR